MRVGDQGPRDGAPSTRPRRRGSEVDGAEPGDAGVPAEAPQQAQLTDAAAGGGRARENVSGSFARENFAGGEVADQSDLEIE